MKKILIILFFIGLWSAFFLDRAPTEVSEAELTQPVDIDYKMAAAAGNHNTNECWFADTTLFDETITIVYPKKSPDNDIVGTWNGGTNVLSLMDPEGMELSYVAHEVSHMVDTFMEKYDVQDQHFEAYMQGLWTECVHKIMLIDKAERKGFFFAN